MTTIADTKLLTEIPLLDAVLEGGVKLSTKDLWPRHYVAGKTNLGLRCIDTILSYGSVCAYLDSEHALDHQYLDDLGVTMEKQDDGKEDAAMANNETSCRDCDYQRDLANRADHAKVVAIQERDMARVEIEMLCDRVGEIEAELTVLRDDLLKCIADIEIYVAGRDEYGYRVRGNGPLDECKAEALREVAAVLNAILQRRS